MKLSQVVVHMLAVVLEIKKKIEIVLDGVPGVALIGVQIVHPIAIKFYQVVVNMLAVVSEI